VPATEAEERRAAAGGGGWRRLMRKIWGAEVDVEAANLEDSRLRAAAAAAA
jgi:hypothetical protein